MDDERRIMWSPPKLRDTNMSRFRRLINEKYSLTLDNYWDLHAWSTKNYVQFWEEVLKFTEMVTSSSPSKIIEEGVPMQNIPKWFLGCRLNYAENLLRFRDDRIALFVTSETMDEPIRITYRNLFDRVSKFVHVLKRAGVRKSDRVAGFIPNGLVAVVAMLAAASIGAVWTSTSPDFGVTGTLNRLQQIEPKVLISVDKIFYNGRERDNLEKLEAISKGLTSLELTVISPYDKQSLERDISKIKKSCFLPDALAEVNGACYEKELEFEQVPFDHPLYILYSSGTTGPPKCMVHSIGGTLIKHLSEHVLHGNMSRDDVFMFHTTTGWMMWCWLVSALAIGASVVLYDGSPFRPNLSTFWDLVDKVGITILGIGVRYLSVLEAKGVKPRKTHELKSLHTILSTGSPLPPHCFDYVYRDIKENVLLGSITGGCDIISCFAGQNPEIPVHRGEIQCPLLGMAVECYDENGRSIVGEKGELVCTKPFPCMPTHFWNDPKGEKYKKAYFSKYPGVWNHGDFCWMNPATKGIEMLGRSDGTLNPNGIRFGSAEIYKVVESMKEVQDSLCVSQYNSEGEERVVLFLMMAKGYNFDQDIVQKIQCSIRNVLSALHVPSLILETKDIPYTITGKKVEIAVKKIISGEQVLHKESYMNPESLDLYYDIPELKSFLCSVNNHS